MCGIAGFTYSSPAPDHDAVARDMLAAIGHRGPDEQGINILDNAVFAHNRLTIMEPRGGQQPRLHPSSGNALIFNGEIYSHRDFDTELEALGCELRDHCDTETLFWLLESYGLEKTLNIIDGMFAFAWYHASSETLYLVRDRFGQKPLFYAERDGELVFASEIKALRRHPALQHVSPDLQALRLFLLMEYVPESATGLTDVWQLPAGHVLAWTKTSRNLTPYWRPADVARESNVDSQAAVNELDELLGQAVQQQLVADVPVGVFLSGGLDSSLVAAMACKHHADVATFTVKFPFGSFDESQHAARVADALGTRHTAIELDRQTCIDSMAQLLEQADQPFADSSALPSFLLCKATKSHVAVALGGDGADELFFGYPNFKLLKFAPLMAALPKAAGTLLHSLASVLPGSSSYMNRRFLAQQLSYGIGEPVHLQSIYWMSAVPVSMQRDLWRAHRTIDPGGAPLPDLSLLEQAQRQFIESYLAGDILQKMDRASMSVSLEVRSPFLSNAVSEFALRLPVEESFRGMQGKRILRQVASRYLDSATIDRPKHGFALPVANLLRGDLRDLAESVLLDNTNPMYEHIRQEAVTQLWERHVGRQRDFGKSLWSLLMLAAFMKNHC